MGGIDFGELTGFIVIASGAAVLGMSYFAAYLLGKNAARKEMDRRDLTHSVRVPDRMDQIEAAVESIAVEVERIAEGQRFLLGSRGSGQPAASKLDARRHKTPV
jgi:hypothetical protein